MKVYAKILFMLFTTTQIFAQAIEGRVLFFDGKPAANIKVKFTTPTDIKEMQLKANKSALTNAQGKYTILNMIPNADYQLTTMFPLNSTKGYPMISSKAMYVNVPKQGTKLIPDIILYPMPSDAGFYYIKNSSSRLTLINNLFRDSCRVDLSTFSYNQNDYYYLPAEEMKSKKCIAELSPGGMIIQVGYNDSNWSPRPPQIQFNFRLLTWVNATGINYYDKSYQVNPGYYAGIQGFRKVSSWWLPNESNSILSKMSFDGDGVNYSYFTLNNNVGDYVLQNFSQGGYNIYYQNYGYLIRIK